MAHERRTLSTVLAHLLEPWDTRYYDDQFTEGAFPEERDLAERVREVRRAAADSFEVVLSDGIVLEVKVSRKRGREAGDAAGDGGETT